MEPKEIGTLSVFAWVAAQAGQYVLGIGILLMSLVLRMGTTWRKTG